MKRKAIYIAGVVLSITVIFVVFRFASSRFTCQTEERLKIDDPAGFRFQVEYKSCDTLAKEETISIYATKIASKGAGLFSRWRDQRTLLFRYDPGRWDNPLPTITRPSQSEILISLPEVSSIEYQNREWEKMSINYAIGRVDYPTASKSAGGPGAAPDFEFEGAPSSLVLRGVGLFFRTCDESTD